jgi:acetyl esterase/lipase
MARRLPSAFPFAAGLVATVLLCASGWAQERFRNPSALDVVLWLPETQPDARIRYAGDSALQFGDLRLPAAEPPQEGFPVAIFIHGGNWTSDWTKDYSSRFVEALTNEGMATWDLEFRRVGNWGGGYPGTFLDVAMGADHLRELAKTYRLDLERVVAVGHSSGGHLALWLAARKNLPASSRLHTPDPLPIAGVVSLAGTNDLELSLELGDRAPILPLVGARTKEEAGPRFAETNPAELLRLGVPQVLIVGAGDSEWRVSMIRQYARAAEEAGDTVTLAVAEGANHFDVVDPDGPGFPPIAAAVLSLAGGPSDR